MDDKQERVARMQQSTLHHAWNTYINNLLIFFS